MDGASSGVTGGSVSGAPGLARPVSLAAVLPLVSAPLAFVSAAFALFSAAFGFVAAANAVALSTAAAFSAAGSSGGRLRMLTLWEAQPCTMARMPTPKANLISSLRASTRQDCRACPRFVAAHRHCRGDHRGRRRQSLNPECLAATPVPVHSI